MTKLFALLLAIVLMLGVCAAATAEEPVTITFWHTYGDAETPVIDDVIIPMFEAANPDIKVEAIRQSGDFNQMLVTALGTGMVPDVARVDITKTSAYAKLGGIVAMDEIEGFDALKDAVLQAVPDAAAASVSRTSGRATSPNARDNDYLALVTPVQLLGVFRASDGARRLSSIAVALFGVLLGALFAFAAFQAITFPGQQYPVTLMLMLFIGAYLALLCVVEAPAAILGAGKYGAGGHAGASGRLAILGKWALFGVSVLGVAFFVLLVFAVVLNV